ncbi:MAG: ABC-F family ATP-binding cassette domain-containing protein [Ruminiclostridium sp.]|nr:ABC-F family ATP-binding cassette domain-containing protein [Ruminiclostridium sp.]
MVTAEKLSFGFPEKDLYKEISFALEPGRHCALIGSNGTGKTTLVDIIRRPEGYLFDGKLLTEGAGRIGYLSQFTGQEKNRNITVFDYLSEEFIRLQEKTDAVCGAMETAEELDDLLERYQLLLDEAQSIDADNYERNIQRQLRLAELDGKADLELSKLSGGEYKLVQVIRQMLRYPGLLIMDEPDVFLDFENLTGLGDLINAYEGTLLVITHSRYLLGRCFDKIWHLENCGLQEFDGTFLEYNYSLLQGKIELQEATQANDAEIRRTEEMVVRLRKEATLVADPVKGRALKAKVSYLGRLEARNIKAPFVELRRPEIALPVVEEEIPDGEEDVLLQVTDYSLAFEEKLLEKVSFTVRAHEKIAIVGANGTGKTSLLRELWVGNNPAVRYSENARIGFFSQLQEETLNVENTCYQEFYELGFETPRSVEEYLQGYCFAPDHLDQPIEKLSGGEKNLLQLAKLCAGNANLLLLDEPSGHLDTYAQMALDKALAEYRGAILMVSHDFYSIANCADAILYVENGTIRHMSPRGFRKMIYKHHFSREYLELEAKKKELETRILLCLQEENCEEAKTLCEALGTIVEQM